MTNIGFTKALYYPTIDIQDDAWLKTSLLYWDEIRTIVPASISEPYTSETAKTLRSEGFLLPLQVTSEGTEVEALAEDVLTYLNTPEGARLFATPFGGGDGAYRLHLDKLSRRLHQVATANPAALTRELGDRFEKTGSPSSKDDQWWKVDEGFGRYYMTLLATRLATRLGVGLVTPMPAADQLATIVNLGTPDGLHRFTTREYETYGPRQNMPSDLAYGMLAKLSIEKIGITPDTPISTMLQFKKKHQDELGRFRTEVAKLVASVDQDLSAEALSQRVSDIYVNDVGPAVTALKGSLSSFKIKWYVPELLQVTLLSAATLLAAVPGGSTLFGVDAETAQPIAALIGAGVSLIALPVRYSRNKHNILDMSPYSYLLSLEGSQVKNLGTKLRQLIP